LLMNVHLSPVVPRIFQRACFFYTVMLLPWRLFKAYYAINWGYDVVLWLAIAGGLIYWLVAFFTARFPRGQVVFFLGLCTAYVVDGFAYGRYSELNFVLLILEALLPWRLRWQGKCGAGTREEGTGEPGIFPADAAGRIVLGTATMLCPVILLSVIMLRQGNVAGYHYGEADLYALWWIVGGFGAGLLLEFLLGRIIVLKKHGGSITVATTWGTLFCSIIAAGATPQTMASFSIMEACFGVAAWGALKAFVETKSYVPGASDAQGMDHRHVELIVTLCMGFLMLFVIAGSMMLSHRFFGWLYDLTGLGQFWMIVAALLGPLCVISFLALEMGRFPARFAPRHMPVTRGSIKRLRVVYWTVGLAVLVGATVPAAAAIPNFTNPVRHHALLPTSIPSLTIPSNYTGWGEMYNGTFAALTSNLNNATLIPGLWAHPGGFYQTGWDWDTALISLVWAMLDPAIARELIVTFLTGAINPNGMVSHMYGPIGKSGYSQPPLLAWAGWTIYRQTSDRVFLDRIYPLLDREFTYWLQSRDPDGNGVYSWLHRDESGLDDTPALPTNPSNTDALDLTAWLVLDAEVLASMALEVGDTVRASYYTSQRALLIDAVQDTCWDNATGFFYNVDKASGQWIRVKTITGFLALLAGIATTEQATRLVNEHLLNASEFWTPYPVPSTAINEPAFTNVYWRGPVWINTNYFTILGLQRYNFTAEARFLMEKTLNMTAIVYQDRGYLYEYYNPTTGLVTDVFNPGGGSPAENFVGWSGLVAVIMKDYFA